MSKQTGIRASTRAHGAAQPAWALLDIGAAAWPAAAGIAPAPVPPAGSDSWKSATSGNWTTASDWTSGVPGASATATIGVAGAYTVTLNTDQSVESVAVSGAGATLAEGAGGDLTIATTLSIASGAIFDLTSAVGVDESSSNASVTNAGLFESTATGESYVSATFNSTGTVLVTGGTLLLEDNVTLSGHLAGTGTIEFGANAIISAGTTLGVGTLYLDSSADTLTLGAGLSYAGALNLGGGYLDLAGNSFTLTGNAADNFQGGAVVTGGGTMITLGTIALNNLYIDGTSTLVNHGTASVTGNETDLYLGYQTAGTATLINAAGATFDLVNGNEIQQEDSYPAVITNAGLFEQTGAGAVSGVFATFTSTGTVMVTGGTLLLEDNATLSGHLAGTGTIEFGANAIISAGTTLGVGTLYLDSSADTLTLGAGLSYAGALNLGGGYLDLAGNSFTLTGNAADNLQGSAVVTGGGTMITLGNIALDNLYVDGTSTLDNRGTATVTGTSDNLELGYQTAGTATLINAAGATFDLVRGGGVQAGDGYQAAIINAGLFEQTGAKTVSEVSANLTNTGTIEASSSGTIQFSGTTSNLPGSTLTGGTWYADGGGATIEIIGGTITSDAATIILSGTGANLEAGSNGTATLDSSLDLIAAGGALEILGGRNFTVAANKGAFTDNGVLQLGGGTFTATALTLGTGAAITGHGKLAVPVTGQGALTAAGGTLTVTGAISSLGAGALTAATLGAGAGATLSVNGTAITLDAGDIILAGAGSAITVGGTAIDASLATIAATGTLAVQAGRTFTATANTGKFTDDGVLSLAGGNFASTSLTVASTAQISGYGTVTSAIANAGTINATTGTLALEGTLSGAGALSAATGAVLDIGKGGSIAGKLIGAGEIELAAATTLTTGASLTVATLLDTANLTLGAGYSLTNAAADTFALNAATGTITLSGATGDSFTNAGTLTEGGAATADIATAFINSKTVSVTSGTLAFLGAVTNTGTLDAATGLLSVATTISGTGTLDVGTTGTLSLLLGAASGQTADFLGGTGLLELTKPLDFAGTIAGFAGSETIALAASTETTFTYSGGTLTIDNGATKIAALHFSGTYTQSDFAVTNSGNEVLIKFV